MSAGGYNALAYAGGTHNANNNTAYAMYTPSESGESFVIGTYRVSVWIFQRASTEALLLTEVYRNGEVARASFPNKAPAGGWVELGVFDFQGSGTEYVKLLRDPTGPTGYFNADSVRFERLPSRISSLRDLSVGGISVYRPGVTEFTYNAGYETSFITLTPTAADPKAVVEVNGAVLEQGQTSGPIPLEIGENWIPVDVTAENPDYSQRYMVKVKRSSGTSTDADLSGVLLDGGALTGFDPTVTSYTYTVRHNTAAVSVAPIPSHPQATVKVNGAEADGADMPVAVPLNEGANEVRIEVIAQDPAYTKTYALNVIRQKADATLKRLLIDGAQPTRGYQVGGGQNQSPGFEPDVTDYVHAAPVGAEGVVISAEPGDVNAEVRINGASLGEGRESYTAAIPVGPRQRRKKQGITSI
ncbi:cadherin-like beta sandwich domain-containing protein [Paenibacillus sp. YN15]|uniref:cadherin-like beta sandwich domain-containing protein n=1 Tax=Paenibacillus sp. YN15 TaxID=1742774 RepID=UPI0015EB41B3|nr:cadherin-like beta sandwich domain-containing protein [Paenibacillus sp. YN15]